MRLKRMFPTLLLMLAALVLPLSALAEAELTGQRTIEGLTGLHLVNGTYVLRLSGAEENMFAVFSGSGERLSAAYRQIDIRQDMPYYMVTGDPGDMNGRGLVDGSGREVLPPIYGRIDVINDRWIIGCRVQNWSEVVSADVYLDGERIGTLGPEDYTVSSYASAHGAYLGVGGGQSIFYLNSRFERVPGTTDYLVGEEYLSVWGEGVYHPGSGQKAFDPSCSLSPDEVERSLWYDDSGSFIGLQGQVIVSAPASGKAYDNVEYRGGDYLMTRSNQGMGVVDMQGSEVLPARFQALGGSTQSYFAMGYQAVLQDGKLSWVDREGRTTASVGYSMNEGDYQGFSVNGLFVTARALGETLVFTATAGELPQRYEDAVTVSSPRQRILCVKQGGLWGAIDMEGSTVIPFAHQNPLQISYDGTVAIGQNGRNEQVVYTVSYGDEPVVTVTPKPAATAAPQPAESAAASAEDDGWICPACGQLNSLNFCPFDGTARPAEPPACPSCGYVMPDGSTPNFCPNCGSPFH